MLKSREVLLAKAETTYNVDPGLTAADNAILAENLGWALDGARIYKRSPVKSTFAPLKSLYAGSLMSVTFDTEIKGSGSAGVAPEIGPLFGGAGFLETITGGTSVEYTPASSGHSSLTLYYYQDGMLFKLTGCRGGVSGNLETGAAGKLSWSFKGHTKMRGTLASATATTAVLPSTFSATDDVYNGQTLAITSGTGAGQSKTIADYTGSTKTCTVTTWTTTPDNTSVFEIDNGPIDTALVTPTYDSVVPVPLIAVPFSADSYSAVISKLAFDTANAVASPADISSPDGFGEIRITGREVTGSFDPEAVAVATYDFFNKFKTSAAMALSTGTIGTAEGNRYLISAPAMTYTNVGKGDRDAISTYDIPFMAAESSGDDELSILFT